MPYITNTDTDRKEMLEFIGVQNFEGLLTDIPKEFILREPLNLSKSSNEWEVTKKLSSLSNKNVNTNDFTSYLGAGSYDHFIPTAIGAITSRPEFATAYTPYQAEVSQGTLQAVYEFQTLICNLTGMDVCNASMYDGPTALGEACVLAASHTKKKKILLASTTHPTNYKITETYTKSLGISVELIPEKNGLIDFEECERMFDDSVAAIVVQTPNFYGNLEEDVQKISDLAHSSKKCLFILSSDPTSLGMLKKPAEYGADIYVGEGQSLGIPQSYGGPYLGLFATTKKLMRKIPGRVVGVTEDTEGKRGFVLTLQTREQHIRREKATSNICSNQALMALTAGVYLDLMGKEGMKEVAKSCYLRTQYLANQIEKIDGFELTNKNHSFFKEFTVKTTFNVDEILEKMMDYKIFAGLAISKFGKNKGEILIAVTEKRSKEELDFYIESLKKVIAKI